MFGKGKNTSLENETVQLQRDQKYLEDDKVHAFTTTTQKLGNYPGELWQKF
jgi:hypothetical protein